jgi:hypothetical protein
VSDQEISDEELTDVSLRLRIRHGGVLCIPVREGEWASAVASLQAAREREKALWRLLDDASRWLYDWTYKSGREPTTADTKRWLRAADELERLSVADAPPEPVTGEERETRSEKRTHLPSIRSGDEESPGWAITCECGWRCHAALDISVALYGEHMQIVTEYKLQESTKEIVRLAEHYHLHLAAIASGREEHSCAGGWSCPICIARRALEREPKEGDPDEFESH